jgi:hypothetical protein
MDLHATDGSFHGYELTYAGAMHPATDPELLRFSREEMLPALRAAMRTRGFETFDYGDFADPVHPERGWYTFEHKPRYGTNYFGLTNRLTLLSEAYSHESFERRVAATRAFVLEALGFAAARGPMLVELRRGADRRAAALAAAGASLPARAEMERTRERDLGLVGACREEKDAVTGLVRLVDTGESHPVEMPVHASFAGREPRFVPLAWAIEAPAADLVSLLDRHGIRHETLQAPRRAQVRAFRVSRTERSERPFQGHRLVRLEGEEEPLAVELPPGTLLVPAEQPLARLAFLLLEPASDDGLATWGLLGDGPDPGASQPGSFPVLRVDSWEP